MSLNKNQIILLGIIVIQISVLLFHLSNYVFNWTYSSFPVEVSATLTYIILPLLGVYWSYKNIKGNEKAFGVFCMLLFVGILIYITIWIITAYPFIRTT